MLDLLLPFLMVALPAVMALVFFFLAYQEFKKGQRGMALRNALVALVLVALAVMAYLSFFAPVELPFRPRLKNPGPRLTIVPHFI